MKVSIDIDCSPAEARAFLGLPDVAPLQAWMMQEMQDRMAAAVGGAGLDEMMKLWMPGALAGPEMFRDLYSRMAKAAMSGKE